MARNTYTNEDILYKCTIDEIRLRVISDLQEIYEAFMNIHELYCTAVYGSSHGKTSNIDDFSTFSHKMGSYLIHICAINGKY